ncbi:MAG: FixH family protein, partial [Ktedonobacterales bacterium]
ARAAGRRFARLAPYALGMVIVADVLMVLGQAAELAGTFTGALSPVLLGAILFGSRFGTFWWMRQLVALAALLLAIVIARRARLRAPASAGAEGYVAAAADMPAPVVRAIPDWRRELVDVLRDVRHLPRRLVRGWQLRDSAGRLACVLAALLLGAFALSGHAAAVPASQFTYAIAVDLLHLLCEAAWVGGLFYISVVLVPALAALPAWSRARVLALGLPQFGAVAIVSALVLAATGSLNTTIHLTSITQFLSTTYGKTLAIKIEIFLVMVAISFYHAFVLRPRLMRALNATAGARARVATAPAREEQASDDLRQEQRLALGVAAHSTTAPGSPAPADRTADRDGVAPPDVDAAGTRGGLPAAPTPAASVRTLEERLRDWLRREALLAAAVLLCVALLGIFAGTLVPTIPASAGTTSQGVFLQTQQSQGYDVTLKVTPDTFGTNTFIVTVLDAQRKPITGAAVVLENTNLDMDMGTQTQQLQPIGATAPGSYSGRADLTMAGRWQITVKLLLPNVKQPLVVSYNLTAGY